jgi:repressor LexA
MELTKKQKEVYNILADFYRKNGYWPSYREISKIMGLKSSAGPYKHIKALKEKGYVEKVPCHSRSIKILKPIKRNSLHHNEKINLMYWLIQFQEHYSSLSGLFNMESFDEFAASIGISDMPVDKENIELIKKEYRNLKQ